VALEIGLPELMRPHRRVLEPVAGTDDDVGRIGGQIIALQDPIQAAFADVLDHFISDIPGKFSG